MAIRLASIWNSDFEYFAGFFLKPNNVIKRFLTESLNGEYSMIIIHMLASALTGHWTELVVNLPEWSRIILNASILTKT